MVGGALDVSQGLLDTCPLTDGPQPGGGILPSPTQALSGIGQDHLPPCNAQLSSQPLRSGPAPAAPACDQPLGGEGLEMGSWRQGWGRLQVSSHQLTWIFY